MHFDFRLTHSLTGNSNENNVSDEDWPLRLMPRDERRRGMEDVLCISCQNAPPLVATTSPSLRRRRYSETKSGDDNC